MFTGIIEEVGTADFVDQRAAGARLTVRCSAVIRDATLGASIAVNGTCLTAIELATDHFQADLAPETLRRTNLGYLRPGALVNLERPLRADSRLDGHFVLGHVDATAEIVALDSLGEDNWWLRIRVPEHLTKYVVEKGSLAVDGISLTVADIDRQMASFTIIPHTYENTTLHCYSAGSIVNVEVDILAKHVEKLVATR